MSHVSPIGSMGIVDSDQHPQPPAGTETIGVTYVPSSENSTLRRIVGEAELQVIQRTLQHTGWNRKRAAAILKISYRGLLYKIRRHSLTPPSAGKR